MDSGISSWKCTYSEAKIKVYTIIIFLIHSETSDYRPLIIFRKPFFNQYSDALYVNLKIFSIFKILSFRLPVIIIYRDLS